MLELIAFPNEAKKLFLEQAENRFYCLLVQ